MPEYTKTGSVVLFKNTKRQPGTNQPDWNGTLTLGEVEHRISGWTKTDKNGNSFISGATSLVVADDASDEASDAVSSEVEEAATEQTELF